MTDVAGMQNVLSNLTARNTTHRQQWVPVIKELDGIEAGMAVPSLKRKRHDNCTRSQNSVTRYSPS
ncbi:hypothetical protein [Palleronia sp. LCG004]|uniref:hypothetical protein n=1 Tax=Palleronia sp. LCG004 TaxID=3079304 RepID=UPI002943A0B7|nr:hypothetical protein [Palleronia sp. LCG004]WOI56972.1 hypothetical protein RVY76_04030 [Palleronia sp. LCG004]